MEVDHSLQHTRRPFRRAPINHLEAPTPESQHIRSIPELVDFNARHNPSHLFCVQARKQAEPFKVTHLQLQNAVRQCAVWLQSNISGLKLPTQNGTGEVVKSKPIAVLMESDLGLVVHLVALLSLGVPALLLSARLSPLAVGELLSKTEATSIITSKRLRGIAEEAVTSSDDSHVSNVSIHQQASYESFFEFDNNSAEKPISNSLNYVADTDRNVLILHSSGTTGLPKPLYSSHRYTLCFTAAHRFSSEEEAQALVLSTLPLYHGYGLVAPWLSLGVGKTFCLPPSGVVSNGSGIATLLRNTGTRALMTVPSILEEIAELPQNEGVRTLRPLDFVAFGGGPLKAAIGDGLAAAGVKLLNHYGATEIGPLAPFFSPPVDYNWRYFRLRKDMDLDLIKSTPEVSDGEQSARYKLVAHPFGWNAPFEVQDELVTDLANPGADFATLGRKDDMIVLATGEKVVPTILESQLSLSPYVRAAVAFGDNQFELGVIVEAAASVTVGEDELRNLLWPIAIEAGEKMDAHARLSSKEAIIITPASRPVPRSDKGSVMRRETYQIFAADIEQAYTKFEENAVTNMPPLSMDNLEESIQHFIQRGLAWRVLEGEWGEDDDLFELGMDSLQALRLHRYLLSAFPGSKPNRIGKDFIYIHPTIHELASAVRMASQAQSAPNGVHNGVNGHTAASSSIDNYFRQFKLPGPDLVINERRSVVLLTGSTGNLGAHLLHQLVGLPQVSRIICLNRRPRNVKLSPLMQQEQSLKGKGLTLTESEWAKVELFQTSTAQPMLGLDRDTYSALSSQVTHVLHNAWPVDFKLSLPSFKTQFQTLHNLLSFARDTYLQRELRSRFVFISSIAVVGQYHQVHGHRTVPEVEMQDERCTNRFGYGQAKLVCEKVLESAAVEYSKQIETTSIRIGQMCGSIRSGYWNEAEHIAALVKSSQTIGRFPVIRGTLSWIPVDTTAAVVSDILQTDQPLEPVYHIENPVRQSWHDTLNDFATELWGIDQNFVPYDQWLKTVLAAPDKGNPVKMLADFFEHDFERMASGSIILDTGKARNASPTLSQADIVGKEQIATIVRSWTKSGFLKQI